MVSIYAVSDACSIKYKLCLVSDQTLLEYHPQTPCKMPINMAMEDPSSRVIGNEPQYQEAFRVDGDCISDDMGAKGYDPFVVTGMGKSGSHHPEPMAVQMELQARRFRCK